MACMVSGSFHILYLNKIGTVKTHHFLGSSNLPRILCCYKTTYFTTKCSSGLRCIHGTGLFDLKSAHCSPVKDSGKVSTGRVSILSGIANLALPLGNSYTPWIKPNCYIDGVRI